MTLYNGLDFDQKCLILRTKTLVKVLHNTSLKVLLPWQHTRLKTSSILKAFLAPSAFHFNIRKWCLVCMIQPSYKYVSSSLWPRLTFFKRKITNILKSSGWGLEKSELPWEQNFYSRRCVVCRTVSLPSFNGLRRKFAKVALFAYVT